ncbi:DUF327 family protein, partial [Bacillus altitudinis]|uniref:DUF327 family protein n=1 Tax=Bacillus altitudinis TaxID=293387 RepID=UPI003B517F9B
MLSHIQLFPKKLTNSPNLKHFPTFKPLLKRFLKQTLHNPLNIQTSTTFHIYPNTPTLPLLKALHQNLIHLTHHIINHHKPSIHFLQPIPQIKPLFINLYTYTLITSQLPPITSIIYTPPSSPSFLIVFINTHSLILTYFKEKKAPETYMLR